MYRWKISNFKLFKPKYMWVIIILFKYLNNSCKFVRNDLEIFQYQYSSIIPLHEKNVINDGIK